MIELSSNIIDRLVHDCLGELESSKFYDFKSPEEIGAIQIPKDRGVLYFIYVRHNSIDQLMYVGKSRGKYFRTRLRSHLFGIGKGTQSKYHKVISQPKDSKILIKYVELKPDSLRNIVEELLIERFKKQNLIAWNFEKK